MSPSDSSFYDNYRNFDKDFLIKHVFRSLELCNYMDGYSEGLDSLVDNVFQGELSDNKRNILVESATLHAAEMAILKVYLSEGSMGRVLKEPLFINRKTLRLAFTKTNTAVGCVRPREMLDEFQPLSEQLSPLNDIFMFSADLAKAPSYFFRVLEKLNLGMVENVQDHIAWLVGWSEELMGGQLEPDERVLLMYELIFWRIYIIFISRPGDLMESDILSRMNNFVNEFRDFTRRIYY